MSVRSADGQAAAGVASILSLRRKTRSGRGADARKKFVPESAQ
ncbi:hypothetical protein BURMUCF1_2977 [Burkholderia multivorans ATCC BAA-247]|jgi:hypothetical protein|uniref:Uncharacterized protein n=1 Tax=Burkholderia multivorans CGD2 TaxID=513052 RepID=B9BVU8_9BURK|nr:hypothetical protein BURMUCGD2_0502 [Burkholderia multivorans CGD2]EEE12495.1 hypothetical protein BURMUCGD2M_0591 [Burkholderia multivorans CGD2M]EJO56485.1 hypothetical protein BURMUCF1_2977 [Burkholderia multivorans ATCC BAA-247]